MQEEQGSYWFVIELIVAGPQSVWEWKVYTKRGGHVAAKDCANSQNEARQAAKAWIAGQSQ